MNKIQNSFLPLVCVLVIQITAPHVAAESRFFTDKSGRTIRGELVSINGEQVTIKREDGQVSTLPAASFSLTDIEYFKKNGLKVTGVPEGRPTPAAPPVRLDVKVNSGKQVQTSRSGYENNQKVSYRVDIKNSELKRDLENAHGVIIALAKVASKTNHTTIVSWEEFDCSIKALETFTYETKKPVSIMYYPESSYGLRAAGYLFVLTDPKGNVLKVSSSSDAHAKSFKEILKLKNNDVFDGTYHMVEEHYTSYIGY